MTDINPVITQVTAWFIKAFQAQFDFPLDPKVIEITRATQQSFGHYQCNSAMRLGKQLGQAPKVIAENMVRFLKENARLMFAALEVSGPGFINIWLDADWVAAYIQEMAQQEKCGVPLVARKERVVIDFSSPNIAKEMHVGHLRSTIIGECLARVFEWMGHEVLRLNHLGDWGTAFGMLITYLKQFHPKVITEEETSDLPQLMQWYRESKKLFDSDEDFKRASQQAVVALQSGESEALRAWQEIVAISERAYQAIYQLLKVHVISRGESFYNAMLPTVVLDAEQSGHLEIDNGAKCLFLEGFHNRDGTRLPFIIQKSDGGYNYASTDLAAMKHRIQQEKADRIIIVLDSGQSLHLKMLYQAAILLGYLDPNKVRFDHVGFGLVLGPDGKKFKTRSGDTEKLIDLLTEAIARAKVILLERKVCENEEELNKLSEILGINAVKYADLLGNRQSDYVFSYDKMLRFEGNTAAFLMYALVRIKSIRRRIGWSKPIQWEALSLVHPCELALGVQLAQFPELLASVLNDLLPNRIAEYLFELAEKFNAFFRDCHVEGSAQEASRMALCAITARVLETGLNLLGLQSVERM